MYNLRKRGMCHPLFALVKQIKEKVNWHKEQLLIAAQDTTISYV